MAVEIEQLVVGAIFKFRRGLRRITAISDPVGVGFDVSWEYADDKQRTGPKSGKQWAHYFKMDAIEQVYDPRLDIDKAIEQANNLDPGTREVISRVADLLRQANEVIDGLTPAQTIALQAVTDGALVASIQSALDSAKTISA